MRWIIDLGDERKEVSILWLISLYVHKIDKEEYPDFECWKADMIRNGLLSRKE